mmetsp:Transcript_65785/g.117256  ORF Transcript_65785/g.117256 Transcript_65785/m.117256 type:complete len:354 (-) Transcript_65785:303-1364(-)
MTGSKTSPSGKPAAKGEASTAVAGRSSRNCLHKQLRKTKFCMFHLQGACQFGKDCAFAHSVTEMNGTPDLRKTQLCKAFAEGKCEDPQCNFAHGETELRSTDMFFKKSLCIWNEKGKCRNGSQCRFAHGLTELRLHIGKEAAHAAETAAQNKGGRRRKGKANSEKTSSTGSGSSSDNAQNCSVNSPRSGSSSDNFSHQGAAEPMKVQPMKVQPQSVRPPESGSPVVGDQVLFQQQQQLKQLQQLQHQYQETLRHCLGAVEGGFMTIEAARWQQQMSPMATNGYNPELRADLENLRQGIKMLAAQCNQIQERMQAAPAKLPTYAGSMLQESGMGKPFPIPGSMQLLQMQMQNGA